MPHDPLEKSSRIDALCGDFESSFSGGRRLRIEAVLADAEPDDRTALLAELIALEFELRSSAGETASLSEYQERFPDDEDALAAAILRILSAGAFRAVVTPRDRLQSNLEADRLRLGDRLGAGAMGVVFRGRDVQLNRDLAVKILADEWQSRPNAIARFVREARICARLQHPGIIPVHEMGWLDERPYFTMKLAAGQSLAEALAARRSPADDLPRLLEIFARVCETMAYAHAQGVVHRDLKPGNVMLGQFGEVYVIDWGLAKELTSECPRPDEDAVEHPGDSLPLPPAEREAGDAPLLPASGDANRAGTLLGTIVGTPGYMSPEQAGGDPVVVDRRADVFALGAVLCEILTGEPPYPGRPDSTPLEQARHGDLDEALGKLDTCAAERELADLARDCLALEPAARPPDAGSVLRRLTAYLRGVQERLRKAELDLARTEERRRRRRVVLALAASLTLLLASVGAGAVWLAQRESARRREESRQAEQIQRQLAEALDEVEQLYAEAPADWRTDPPRRTRIRELARRAETLAQTHSASPADDRRVVALCERILAEDADIRLLERLDQIRLERAQVHAASGRYDSGRIGPLYRQAFTDYGLDVAARDPQVAADKLSGRPRHVLEACIFGLESWRAFLQSRVAEALWIDQVLELIDDDDWRREVRRACRQKDWPSVERLISTVQDEPASVDAVNLVAMQLINASQFELAHQLLQAVQPSYPGDFWINQFLGITWEHIPGRRPDESIRFYTAALAIRETAATYQNLGGILFELERDSEAEQAFRSAARMRPDWVVPHLDLAKLLAKQERLNEALECADQAVAAAPDQARVASIRGQIMIGLGRREEGLASLRRAVELDDKTAAWHLALGRALRDTGQLLEAVTCFRRTIELDHENVMGQEMLRDTLTDQGQTDGAIQAARAVVSLRGKPDDYLALARLLEEQGKRDEAESIRKQVKQEADRR